MSGLISEFREANKTNVAKVRTCYELFATRNDERGPKSQQELVDFLKGGTVDKNLKRLGLSVDEIDDIFVSERDGEPIKVKWGQRVNFDNPQPVAFETTGVDGVRLVAATEILEVETDERYQELWEGKNFKSSIVDSDDELE